MRLRQALTSAVVTVSAAATVTVGALDANRPPPTAVVTRDAGAMSECVIPDCRRVTGRLGWDPSHGPVDCRFGGPFATQQGAIYGSTGNLIRPAGVYPVWRGCNVGPREYAVGPACLPARCTVIAGEDPLAEVP